MILLYPFISLYNGEKGKSMKYFSMSIIPYTFLSLYLSDEDCGNILTLDNIFNNNPTVVNKGGNKGMNKNIGVKFVIFSIFFIVIIVFYQVYLNVGTVHNFFSPMNSILVEGNSTTEMVLEFDSIFWDKAIVNDANNEGVVLVEVENLDGKAIVSEVVQVGEFIELNQISRFQEYILKLTSFKSDMRVNIV